MCISWTSKGFNGVLLFAALRIQSNHLKKLVVAVYVLRFWAVTSVLLSYKPGGGKPYFIGQ